MIQHVSPLLHESVTIDNKASRFIPVRHSLLQHLFSPLITTLCSCSKRNHFHGFTESTKHCGDSSSHGSLSWNCDLFPTIVFGFCSWNRILTLILKLRFFCVALIFCRTVEWEDKNILHHLVTFDQTKSFLPKHAQDFYHPPLQETPCSLQASHCAPGTHTQCSTSVTINRWTHTNVLFSLRVFHWVIGWH